MTPIHGTTYVIQMNSGEGQCYIQSHIAGCEITLDIKKACMFPTYEDAHDFMHYWRSLFADDIGPLVKFHILEVLMRVAGTFTLAGENE